MSNSKSIIFYVEDKIMLPDQSSTQHNFVIICLLCCKTVHIVVLSVEILARVPIEIKVLLIVSYKFKSYYWKRFKKGQWALWKSCFVVSKANCVLSVLQLTLTIEGITITEPLKVCPNLQKQLTRKVRKSGPRVYKAHCILFGTIHKVIIHTHTSEINFEVAVRKHRDPSDIF